MRSSTMGALAALAALTSVTAQPAPYEVQTPPLDTDWTYEVGTDPWKEYPRPQLKRDAWQSLNGIWTYQAAESAEDVTTLPEGQLEREIMIPSCIESGLSGIQDLDVRFMWFQTSFEIPEGWDSDSILLNFEAVDYEATVFVNGEEVGSNVGGYHRFTIDLAGSANVGESNELLVFVHDPTDSEIIPVGKQVLEPSHIFYRPCSGIWQTVWLEPAPANHVTQLDVSAASDGTVTVKVHNSGDAADVEVSVIGPGGSSIATGSGTTGTEFTFEVDSPDLWSPSSPTLYNLTVTAGNDEITSYTGFRTISMGEVDGVVRPLLNGEFFYIFGTLDQGYWPDGLHLPPNREAMVYDLELLKDFGFNMVRKHIKIEPDLFYEACDRLGLLVIQDMPSLPVDTEARPPTEEQKDEFQRQLEIMINEHKSYTSIGIWVIFNEGWGQDRTAPWHEEVLTEVVRNLDSTRLINSVSGWFDHGYGDFDDNHHYANPQCGSPTYSTGSGPYDPTRIALQGEFGGLGHNVSIEHLWNVQQAIDQIPETYEISETLEAYNHRAHLVLDELRYQTEMYACSGGVYTQTTDVEGEVNGLITYDRRFIRPDVEQWKADIQALYDAAEGRGGVSQGTKRK